MIPASRIALVLGGTGDIGQAVARRLLSDGFVVLSTSTREGTPVLERIAENAFGMRADLTDEGAVIRVFEAATEKFGRVDLMVNCTGMALFKPLAETSLDEWRQVIDLNLTSLFLCAREAFRRMQLQGGGRIIHLGSTADHLTLSGNGAYSASKFGARALTQVLNEEGKDANVRACLLSIGAVSTRLWNTYPEFDRGQMLTPEDVAQAVSQVASWPLNVRLDEMKLMPPKGVL